MIKDPIRIHQRQLDEMERLLRERIAPPDAQFNACQTDTALKVDADGHVFGARPLMNFHPVHAKVFCECKDWPSKWPEDRAWCQINNLNERFYDHPYNFMTDGF